MASDPTPKGPSPWQAIEFVSDILMSIAVPTVLFAIGGRWLDRHFGTTPLFMVIGLLLSLGIVATIVTRKGKAMSKLLK